MKQKVKYSIEPHIKKRWFKENETYYDIIKETEETTGKNITIGKLNVELFPQKEIKTVFSSTNLNEVLTMIQHLNKINK